MKLKLFIVSIFVLIQINGFSQTELTNAQVYDFNVGDIFQVLGSGSTNTPPTYETKTVLLKSFSSNNDTIFYSIKRESYTLQKCVTCNPIIALDTIIQVVTKLTSPADHNNQTSCSGTHDTIFKDYGNKLVWERHPQKGNICFEPTSETSQLIEGVGGPFYTLDEPEGPSHSQYELVYYKKQSDSYGTLSTSINQMKNISPAIEIYPNPSKSILYIKSTEKYTRFVIIDQAGKVMKSDNLTNETIDILELNTGLYILQLFTNNKIMVSKMIEKI